MGSFIWVVQVEGERELEIRIVVWLVKPESLLVKCCVFKIWPRKRTCGFIALARG
jgi:hypothetical protein